MHSQSLLLMNLVHSHSVKKALLSQYYRKGSQDRELEWLAQAHTACRWWSWDLNLWVQHGYSVWILTTLQTGFEILRGSCYWTGCWRMSCQECGGWGLVSLPHTWQSMVDLGNERSQQGRQYRMDMVRVTVHSNQCMSIWVFTCFSSILQISPPFTLERVWIWLVLGDSLIYEGLFIQNLVQRATEPSAEFMSF